MNNQLINHVMFKQIEIHIYILDMDKTNILIPI